MVVLPPAELAVTNVDQSLAHVPKDIAVPNPDSAERETAIVAMDAS